jgi:hypothetical protein
MVTNDDHAHLKNIETKKPEELINLIDNILNYINVQKEAGNENLETDNDDTEDYNHLFGKFYYEFNKTMFKKINLEEEYNFILNNIGGKVFSYNLIYLKLKFINIKYLYFRYQ